MLNYILLLIINKCIKLYKIMKVMNNGYFYIKIPTFTPKKLQEKVAQNNQVCIVYFDYNFVFVLCTYAHHRNTF